jgi:DNA-binding FadR family transcriptional regulator
VAVATFNEAVRMLETRGVVELRPGPGGGVFVARPPALVRLGHKMLALSGESVSVADSLAVRNALEPHVVAAAVRYHTPGDVDDLRALIKRMADCTDFVDYLHANWAIHRRMADICPNVILRQIYLGLLDFAEERVHGVNPLDQRSEPNAEAIAIHTDLIEAIAAGDNARATAAIETHAKLTDLDPPVLATPVPSVSASRSSVLNAPSGDPTVPRSRL